MAYKSKSKKKSIANARKVKAQKCLDTHDATDLDSDIEVTAWTGGVNNHLLSESDDSDSDFNDAEWESDSSGDDVDELEGEELVASLQKEIEHEIQLLQELMFTPYERISTTKTAKEWQKVERNRGLGYNGQSKRTQRFRREKAREKAEEDKITRKR